MLKAGLLPSTPFRLFASMIWLLTLPLLLQHWCALFAGQDKTRSCPIPESIKDKDYHPGQVWQYRTRDDEPNSRLTVLRVENLPELGTVVHVRIDGVRLRNCAGGPEPDTIQHMPFTKDAFARSVTKLLKDGSKIPTLDGYDQWRRDCGGVYTITVAQAVNLAEFTFRHGLGCQDTDGTQTTQ